MVVRVFSDQFYQVPVALEPRFEAEGIKRAAMDDSGVLFVDTKPYPTLLERLKKYLCFIQDPDLLAVNRRLQTVLPALQDKDSSIFQAVKQEIHPHGTKGFSALWVNLDDLDSAFRKGNDKSILTLLVLKVFNFFLMLFGHAPIELKPYEIFDINLAALKEASLSLTEEDEQKCVYSLSGDLTDAFNDTHLHKLECGLERNILFSNGNNRYNLTYDRKEDSFFLAFCGLDKGDDQEGSRDISCTSQETISVKMPGQEKTRYYHAWHEHSIKTDWSIFSSSVTYSSQSGWIRLIPGAEYSLPSDQKDASPLVFTLHKKS